MASDAAILATAVTAVLIRLGGQLELTTPEWEQAILHESTIWVEKTDKTVTLVLVSSKEAKA